MSESENDRRQEFLINMYNQTWNNINRHINVIWQPVGLLIAALGLLSLGEKNIINFDVATALIILFCGWFIAHVYDSSHWFNRNLIIITNIEKQFLKDQDEKEIHYFFKETFPPKKMMITHFRLQKMLGQGIIFVVLFYHFITRFGNVNISLTLGSLLLFLPYLVLIGVLIYLKIHIDGINTKYRKLITKSPGKGAD